jgi:hypothetical protein
MAKRSLANQTSSSSPVGPDRLAADAGSKVRDRSRMVVDDDIEVRKCGVQHRDELGLAHRLARQRLGPSGPAWWTNCSATSSSATSSRRPIWYSSTWRRTTALFATTNGSSIAPSLLGRPRRGNLRTVRGVDTSGDPFMIRALCDVKNVGTLAVATYVVNYSVVTP